MDETKEWGKYDYAKNMLQLNMSDYISQYTVTLYEKYSVFSMQMTCLDDSTQTAKLQPHLQCYGQLPLGIMVS